MGVPQVLVLFGLSILAISGTSQSSSAATESAIATLMGAEFVDDSNTRGALVHPASVENVQVGAELVFSESVILAQAQPNPQTAEGQIQIGLQHIQQGQVDLAIAAFERATQLDPNEAAGHYNLGLALRQQGQIQPAANSFYRAIQADPQFAVSYANLGAALLEGNNIQRAEEYLQRAIDLEPERCVDRRLP